MGKNHILSTNLSGRLTKHENVFQRLWSCAKEPVCIACVKHKLQQLFFSLHWLAFGEQIKPDMPKVGH